VVAFAPRGTDPVVAFAPRGTDPAVVNAPRGTDPAVVNAPRGTDPANKLKLNKKNYILGNYSSFFIVLFFYKLLLL